MSITTNSKKPSASNESVLGLAPMQPASSPLGLTPFGLPQPSLFRPLDRGLTKREQRIIADHDEQVLVVDLIEGKAEFGMSKLGELHECASDLFGGTITHVLQNKEAARGTDAEPYVAEFTMRQVQVYARNMLGTLEIAGTRIGEEVYRSLHLPPEEKGFWARLLNK